MQASRIVSLLTRALTVAALLGLCFGASVRVAKAQDSNRVWTVEEIMAERQDPTRNRTRYCNGQIFKPCVCAKDVSNLVQYRPSVKECRNRAAIILSGKYLHVFSVVVRDWLNRDRWPVEGVNNCTPYERDTLGLNKCSVFKVQKIINFSDSEGDAEVHCLGASGYSPLFSKVTRITAKLSDVPDSNQDPLIRWCLAGPTKPLN